MTIVFATHNPNKVKEIQALMPECITIRSLTEIGCHEDIEETASTLEGNALIKARYVRDTHGFSCFADDTGLKVDALEGAPGVYSARYAGEHKSSEDNIEKLLRELKGQSNRKAHFQTVIALIMDDEEFLFEGICKGEITNDKRGGDGFGYDPIFQPDGFDKTFAEMPLELKNKIGHRGKAVKKLIGFLEKNAV